MLYMSAVIPLSVCLIAASHANHVSPELLVSIIAVEGGISGQSSKNKNGTEDLGIMQINTGAWLRLVSDSFFEGNNEKAYMKLRDDGCFNIYVGAWILGRSIRMEGGDIWQGVGRYHSVTYHHKQKYIKLVSEKYKSIFH
ncbi:lytic transglycosylase domain-containing protein [Escherichia coli]|nr:lytic transglycosylase domain-containing protein [Escherichia coli]EFO4711195.1 lytic transglycosylase [Escherichia coli]EIR2337477.1 lytic transglycosylase domain-containing protein [Escherichia coli]MCQ0124531.1 lytic transglycosylase domain-containing protein [Escherichia coli]MCQ0455953.1 lytic transglycosylase domain-containing protein [Escherichia coli]